MMALMLIKGKAKIFLNIVKKIGYNDVHGT